MLIGIVFGACVVTAAFLLAQCGLAVFRRERHFIGVGVIGLGIAVTIGGIALNGGDAGQAGAALRNQGSAQGSAAIAEMARVSASLRGVEQTASSSNQIAAVPSLIDGLRLRLEAQPDDVGGWVLLAQSYAFVGDGNGDRIEEAVARAVELGFDEADLRQRVASARRDPHAGLPGSGSD